MEEAQKDALQSVTDGRFEDRQSLYIGTIENI